MQVAVGDELLIGAEEGGFLELEELRPGGQNACDAAAEPEPGPLEQPAPLKKARIPAPAADVGALQAEVARLREENRQLNGGAADAPAGAGSAKKQAKLSKAREIRQRLLDRKKATKQRRQAAAADKPAAEDVPAADTAKDMPAAEVPPQAAPPTAPSAAWANFGLEAQLLAAVVAQGFTEPTPIQRECLPAAIRDRRDVIGAAQTGSGKTLAFGLPILQALLAERAGGDEQAGGRVSDRQGRGGGPLRALVVAPTRELAMQVCTHLEALGRPCGVWVVPIVGGLAPAKQARLLGRRPPVVVATPGRLWELMREGMPHLTDARALSFLVLDEADRMVQAGHFQARPLCMLLHSQGLQRRR